MTGYNTFLKYHIVSYNWNTSDFVGARTWKCIPTTKYLHSQRIYVLNTGIKWKIDFIKHTQPNSEEKSVFKLLAFYCPLFTTFPYT